MPHRSHRHRHRRGRRESRLGFWLVGFALALLGGKYLYAEMLDSSGGRIVLAVLAGLVFLAVIFILASLTGRLGAGALNFFRLHVGRAELEESFHERQHHDEARR